LAGTLQDAQETTMKIAVQEDMLPGRSLTEQFQNARQLGVDGVEIWGRDLETRAEAIAEAMTAAEMPISSINQLWNARLLAPEVDERERALEELRTSIALAADLGAQGVGFVPLIGDNCLPDLSPWMTSYELQMEMLHQHIRTLEDFAYALGVELYIEPINRYETRFMNRLEQAAALTRRRNHPSVKIVADLFHMALEEADIVAAIQQHGDQIGLVHLADSNRRLPGMGSTDFTAAAAALNAAGYDGWAIFECGRPSRNAHDAPRYMQALPDSIALLRNCGFA
jgi:sugar phosphate isomerase/epimerase